jgi:ubiquinone biosynthesis protein
VIISDIEELKRRKVNIQRLSENGVEIFFTQVFRHNFFHADMHPGNIFVFADDPENPRYAAVDFGIVGTLTPRDQYYLAEMMMSFFDHDYHRIAKLHIDSGWVPAHTRVDELEAAFRTMCEPIFQKPLSEISFGQVLMGVLETARRFEFRMQPQLHLLHKTLLQIEGLGRQLYPELDLWKTAQPIMKTWMRTRLSPLSMLKNLRSHAPEIVETVNLLPQLLHRAALLAADDRLTVPVKDQDAEHMRATIHASARRRDYAILSAALILSATLWFALVRDPQWPGIVSLAAGFGIFWGSRK